MPLTSGRSVTRDLGQAAATGSSISTSTRAQGISKESRVTMIHQVGALRADTWLSRNEGLLSWAGPSERPLCLEVWEEPHTGSAVCSKAPQWLRSREQTEHPGHEQDRASCGPAPSNPHSTASRGPAGRQPATLRFPSSTPHSAASRGLAGRQPVTCGVQPSSMKWKGEDLDLGHDNLTTGTGILAKKLKSCKASVFLVYETRVKHNKFTK